MVPDDLGDDEVEELLGECRIEVGLDGQRPQPGDLPFFAGRISGRKIMLCLQPAHSLGVLETFGQDMDERRIDIVDACADLFEFSLRRVSHAGDSTGVGR